MAGVSSVKQKISMAAASGKAKWSGTNGIKEIVGDLADILRERGIQIAPSITALSSLTAADTGLALVPDVALYYFNPTGRLPVLTPNVAAPGGVWQFLAAMGPQTKSFVIGDSTTTIFTIRHDLETFTPSVEQLETLNGLPFSYVADIDKGTVSVPDANHIQITYITPPGTNQYTIAVKR